MMTLCVCVNPRFQQVRAGGELLSKLWYITSHFPIRFDRKSIMSWVKAAQSSGDDVFDENADDTSLQSKEWSSNMKKRLRVMQMFCLCR